MDVLNFDVQGHKTTITKTALCKLLGIRTGDAYLNPYLVSSPSIIRVFIK